MISLAPIPSTAWPRDEAHSLDMIKPIPKRVYHVIATDPDAAHRIRHVEVRETSRDTAKIAARQELALEKCDHWTITYVVEAA